MKLLSVSEAAERLSVSEALVYALCASKRIRHERHGLKRGTIRIPEDALDEYRQRCTVQPQEEAEEAPEQESPVPVPAPERKGPGIDLW
jgi:excisionase family DNA binding protein